MDSLFGHAKEKVDSAMSSLFGKSSKPLDRDSLLKRQRTVIEVPEEPSREEKPAFSEPPQESTKENKKENKKEKHGQDRLKKNKRDEQDQDRPKKKRKGTSDDLEGKYFSKLMGQSEEHSSSEKEEDKENSVSSEGVAETETAIDEPSKAVTVDLKVDELKKAECTIFVGNLSIDVISSKRSQKDVTDHFKQFGKIKSIRFRSIAQGNNKPKKVTYIKKTFDESQEAINAYIVYENKQDALNAVKLNGTVFGKTHLRVDHLTHPLKEDNKKSIFIGNLDFLETEESLWKFFGEHVGADQIDNVRIIRDSATNFGKGFAIVQFKDSVYVNKALLLDGKELTTSSKPRKLRIQRAKKMNKPQERPNTKQRLSEKEKTMIGRGKKVLGKKDKRAIGQQVIEGERAKKGDRVVGLKNKAGRVRKPRHKKK